MLPAEGRRRRRRAREWTSASRRGDDATRTAPDGARLRQARSPLARGCLALSPGIVSFRHRAGISSSGPNATGRRLMGY